MSKIYNFNISCLLMQRHQSELLHSFISASPFSLSRNYVDNTSFGWECDQRPVMNKLIRKYYFPFKEDAASHQVTSKHDDDDTNSLCGCYSNPPRVATASTGISFVYVSRCEGGRAIIWKQQMLVATSVHVIHWGIQVTTKSRPSSGWMVGWLFGSCIRKLREGSNK